MAILDSVAEYLEELGISDKLMRFLNFKNYRIIEITLKALINLLMSNL